MRLLLTLLIASFVSTPFAQEFNCKQQDACYQSLDSTLESYSEPIKYEQSKEEASKLLLDVLNTLGLDVVKKNENQITASKTSSFLKVVTHFDFSLSSQKLINYKAFSDSPKLDWGDTKGLIEKIKFRFYQNNM